MHRVPHTADVPLSNGRSTCGAMGAFADGAFPITLVPGQKYPAGVELLRQAEIPENVWIIDEGVVKLVNLAEDGRELTVGVRLKGWIVGSASVILSKVSPVAAFTMTPARG